ncbi:MAG TPA: type II toxin-antitoxin system VapC family toxin [Bryobacteraceae bacterium]|nr:type II toxin-antitoxin system VapC family toxin [Bryobacteraceae bacterium]
MAQKTDAYVDTSALIAALDRSDSFHPVFARLFADPPRLVTSALVVAEGHGWFLRRYDQRRAMQFLNFIQELTDLDICPFDQREFTRTLPVVKKFSDQKLTLADAHGLSILSARRIKTCWSTDRHLGLTGATLVM